MGRSPALHLSSGLGIEDSGELLRFVDLLNNLHPCAINESISGRIEKSLLLSQVLLTQPRVFPSYNV